VCGVGGWGGVVCVYVRAVERPCVWWGVGGGGRGEVGGRVCVCMGGRGDVGEWAPAPAGAAAPSQSGRGADRPWPGGAGGAAWVLPTGRARPPCPPVSQTQYACEILDGGDAPRWRVTPQDDPAAAVTSDSASGGPPRLLLLGLLLLVHLAPAQPCACCCRWRLPAAPLLPVYDPTTQHATHNAQHDARPPAHHTPHTRARPQAPGPRWSGR
jgi:hypothetical protein